jgi:peptide-methionine (S)-S-oxide reductase
MDQSALSRRCLLGATLSLPVLGLATPSLAMRLPPPSPASFPAPGAPQVAVLAGGCFWGIQGVFSHVKGVTRAVSGYAGGRNANPTYEQVSSGATGHAEAVQITFDPAQITYGDILQIFFSVATDPTQLNRQEPDDGTQYRGEIFYTSPDQKRIAEAYIAQLGRARVFKAPIVTRVSALKAFYPAEAHHQDFLLLNPDEGYIARYDLPKVADLKMSFPALWRETPIRTAAR